MRGLRRVFAGRSGAAVVLAACWIVASQSTGLVVAAEVMAIANVWSLSAEEIDAEPVVRVRGIVTHHRPGVVILQEGDRGLSISARHAFKPSAPAFEF